MKTLHPILEGSAEPSPFQIILYLVGGSRPTKAIGAVERRLSLYPSMYKARAAGRAEPQIDI